MGSYAPSLCTSAPFFALFSSCVVIVMHIANNIMLNHYYIKILVVCVIKHYHNYSYLAMPMNGMCFRQCKHGKKQTN